MGFCHGQKVHILKTKWEHIPKDVHDGHLAGDPLIFDVDMYTDGQVLMWKNMRTHDTFHISSGRRNYWETVSSITDPRFGVLWILKNDKDEYTPYIPEECLVAKTDPKSAKMRMDEDLDTILNQAIDSIAKGLIDETSLECNEIEEAMRVVKKVILG